MPDAPQPDLFASLAGPDDETPAGTLRGPWEGLGAGLEVWCGPHDGWRRLDGIQRPAGTIMRYQRRLILGLSFDLGPAATFPDRTKQQEEADDTE